MSREEGFERERLLLLRSWKKLQPMSDAELTRPSATCVGQRAEIKQRLSVFEDARAARLKGIAQKLGAGGTVAECWGRLSGEDEGFIQDELAITEEEERLFLELTALSA